MPLDWTLEDDPVITCHLCRGDGMADNQGDGDPIPCDLCEGEGSLAMDTGGQA